MSEGISYYHITNGERSPIKIDTHCCIGIINNDSSVELIYCFHDSRPSLQTPLLLEYFSTEEKVKALISMGDIERLSEYIQRTESETNLYDTSDYHQKTGSKSNKSKKTSVTLLREFSGLLALQCMYVFDSRINKWLFGERDGNTWHFTPFTEPFDEQHLPKGEILIDDTMC